MVDQIRGFGVERAEAKASLMTCVVALEHCVCVINHATSTTRHRSGASTVPNK